jgi:putative DNA primase/helicase
MKVINELRTDVGNGRRLAAAYRDVIRYVHAWKAWLIWDGKRWVQDDQLSIEMYAKNVIRAYFKKAIGNGGEQRDEDAIKHALRSERVERIRAMGNLARSEPGMCIEPGQLDSDPWLLNCANGTVDLHTGELRPHSQGDLITKLAPVVYEPGVRHPQWDAHIEHVTGGDREFAAYLQKVGGYCLTGRTSEEKLLMFCGGPATAKTTHVESKRSVMGDYAATADFETFLKTDNGRGPRNDIARLAGVRLVCASEVPPGRAFDEVTLKQLTGGDTISARFLYGEFFEYKPQFTICLAANHRPSVRDDDPAIWRRLKLVPFVNELAEDKRDPAVKACLTDPTDAGPAILAWMVEGAIKWQQEGLQEPEVVRAATQAYQAETAVLGQFIEDRCVEGPEQWTSTGNLTAAFGKWCPRNGYRSGYGPQRLKQVLRGRGHVPEKRGGVRGWRGIGLAEAA